MKGDISMFNYLNALKSEANKTYTENGAITLLSSGSKCLDLFATIGAIRHESDEDIRDRFFKAYCEDPDIAMRILFYARDIRGGLGERRVFKVILGWLAKAYPESVKKNIRFISEMGRWDDLLCLLHTYCEVDALAAISAQLHKDSTAAMMGRKQDISLLAKWLPSVNTSNKQAVADAKYICKKLRLTERKYRKTLVTLRKEIAIIENNLREKDYTFDYSKQPSKAMLKYRAAFMRNDGSRYSQFLDDVAEGKKSLHTGALLPYEIVGKIVDGRYRYDQELISAEERKSLDVTWNALEDFCDGRNALAVVDGSGSMYSGRNPSPISVALSLGIYFGERNTGMFHNHFITFSYNPRLVEIKGKDIVDKVLYCEKYNECADTNIQKTFELILNAAKSNHIPQSEMPEALYIISDMEFNYCTYDASMTNFEYAKKIFAEAGYKLPRVIFWNVDSRNDQQPVPKNEQGVVLVSGCSPRIFSMAMSEDVNPYTFMMEVINSARYCDIFA